jgi:membrane protein required for colicin V production
MSVSIVLDLLILGFVGWGAYKGFQLGLLEEIVNVLHFIIAFLVSFKVVGLILSLVNKYLFEFRPEVYPEFVFAVAILVSFYLLTLLQQYLKTEIDYDLPGNWDNIVGAVFASIKHMIALSFLFWFLNGVGAFKPILQEKSYMYKAVEKISLILMGVDNKGKMSETIKRFIE